jgi:hypothetical protein
MQFLLAWIGVDFESSRRRRAVRMVSQRDHALVSEQQAEVECVRELEVDGSPLLREGGAIWSTATADH